MIGSHKETLTNYVLNSNTSKTGVWVLYDIDSSLDIGSWKLLCFHITKEAHIALTSGSTKGVLPYIAIQQMPDRLPANSLTVW